MQLRRMEIAVATARDGIGKGQSPFGAAIFSPDGVLISSEHNQVNALRDPSAHAEVVAIRSACQKIGRKSLAGYSLFSTCEPCPMCIAAITFSGIREVVFGADVEDAKFAGFSLLQLPCEQVIGEVIDEFVLQRGVLRERCTELFRLAAEREGDR